jgi:hypothetical protein
VATFEVLAVNLLALGMRLIGKREFRERSPDDDWNGRSERKA